MILSRDEVADLQHEHTEALVHAQLVREVVEDALNQYPMEEPWATKLREGMKAIEERVLH